MSDQEKATVKGCEVADDTDCEMPTLQIPIEELSEKIESQLLSEVDDAAADIQTLLDEADSD